MSTEYKKKETKKPIGNPNDWYIEVRPKRAGDFGFASISSIEYTEKEANDLAEEMMSDIKRHIDSVQGCSLVFNSWLCPICGCSFDEYSDAKGCTHE